MPGYILPKFLNWIGHFVCGQIGTGQRAHFYRFIDTKIIPAEQIFAFVWIYATASIPIIAACTPRYIWIERRGQKKNEKKMWKCGITKAAIPSHIFFLITSTQRHEEIEYGPRQNNDVIDVHPARHNSCSVSDTWHVQIQKTNEICRCTRACVCAWNVRKRIRNEIHLSFENLCGALYWILYFVYCVSCIAHYFLFPKFIHFILCRLRPIVIFSFFFFGNKSAIVKCVSLSAIYKTCGDVYNAISLNSLIHLCFFLSILTFEYWCNFEDTQTANGQHLSQCQFHEKHGNAG